ncbi:MAG TPA: trypsin-like peptidase domain-containing protein, partial [Pirellulales bacterium]|nr:trypsin-like peptidase domain-containing protein [Pirellulales bacterium]
MQFRPHPLAAPLCWGLSLALAVAASPALRPAAATELRRTAEVRAVEQARGSIVNIHGQKTVVSGDDGARRGETPQHVNGMGTGVIIDGRGYIITNYHVVEGVKKIQVTLASGKSYVASTVSHDPPTDLAIIKISAREELPVITVGTSSDLMTGEPVIAVGNAYGYEHTVTRGIVSALHRTVHVSDAQQYQDLIQTDASINPGNSGGPLLNIDGEMIGINVAVRAGAQGIGFAIPVDMAMSIAANLMSVEKIESTYHGVHQASRQTAYNEFVVG